MEPRNNNFVAASESRIPPESVPPSGSLSARFASGLQRLTRQTVEQVRSLLPALPTDFAPPPAADPAIQHRPSLQPTMTGISFTTENSTDLRVHLRELIRLTAQVIHMGLGEGAQQADPSNSLLAEEGRQTLLFAAEVRALAEQLHAQARAQLMDAFLTKDEQMRVDRIFRAIGDILCALRGAETATVALTLLQQHTHPLARAVNAEGEKYLREAACRADTLVKRAALALSTTASPQAASEAATVIREVQKAFQIGDHALRSIPERHAAPFSPAEYRRRVTRAALWSVMICAENMARVAARFAVSAEEQATLATSRGALKPESPLPNPYNKPYNNGQSGMSGRRF